SYMHWSLLHPQLNSLNWLSSFNIELYTKVNVSVINVIYIYIYIYIYMRISYSLGGKILNSPTWNSSLNPTGCMSVFFFILK
ncbi:MAG: hypothetical protein N7Q72_03615, partial [Spiroplasma sp. Tabriz.8]|nr:hypothetical protein [Spiroplasma sp. Tabriz.8]